MTLKAGTVSNIKYHKSEDDITNRAILTLSTPETVVKALDISELTDKERESLLKGYTSYQDYMVVARKQLFTLEQFLESAGKFDVTKLKYRSFTPAKIEEV